ncbi:putative dual-specificity RNA methyltransferase RlmN [Clostridia bacterium]|nr:putative dual-specificity RNA methyltransferase RlmN [Clostridia bacterium]
MTWLDMTAAQIAERLPGQPAYRARQLLDGLLGGAASLSEITNLPKSLRESLDMPTGYPAAMRQQRSEDGTVKTLWRYPDGAEVESVLMRYKHGLSACLSTQAGCRMGCAFCASCQNGLNRSLTGGEIAGQYLAVRKQAGQAVPRIVLMGMGEPLDNLEGTLRALQIFRDIGLSMRHISLSTCGLPDGIRTLAEAGFPVTLSVSLHAADDATRTGLMPINKKYPIRQVLNACDYYFKQTGRRVSYEYICIKDINDGDDQAKKLAKLLKGQPAHVNLIPCNPVKGKNYEPSKKVREFQKILTEAGLTVTVRRSLGTGIEAACGQLQRGGS